MVDSVKRNGPYAPLSANYAEDDAVMLLDLDEDSTAELLYVRALAYSARDLSTEGFISDVAIRAGRVLRRRKGVVEKAAARLVEVGLWTREDDGYRVRSWLKWNKSWDVLTRKRQTDAERKAAGRAAESTGTDDSVHAESTRTDNGHGAESATSPQGVAPPEALHVTTRHDTTPAPAEGAAPDESLGQKANRLTRAYTDRVPLSKFPAISQIVTKAIKAERYTDEQIHDALVRMAEDNRSVTVDALRTELDGMPSRRLRLSPAIVSRTDEDYENERGIFGSSA